jgi:hypothetical protein
MGGAFSSVGRTGMNEAADNLGQQVDKFEIPVISALQKANEAAQAVTAAMPEVSSASRGMAAAAASVTATSEAIRGLTSTLRTPLTATARLFPVVQAAGIVMTVTTSLAGNSARNDLRSLSKSVDKIQQSLERKTRLEEPLAVASQIHALVDMHMKDTAALPHRHFFVWAPEQGWQPQFLKIAKEQPLPAQVNLINDIDGFFWLLNDHQDELLAGPGYEVVLICYSVQTLVIKQPLDFFHTRGRTTLPFKVRLIGESDYHGIDSKPRIWFTLPKDMDSDRQAGEYPLTLQEIGRLDHRLTWAEWFAAGRLARGFNFTRRNVVSPTMPVTHLAEEEEEVDSRSTAPNTPMGEEVLRRSEAVNRSSTSTGQGDEVLFTYHGGIDVAIPTTDTFGSEFEEAVAGSSSR